jgi:hypothetical protein
MKCIRCQTNNTFKDRNAYHGKCRLCRHPFVFGPAISNLPRGMTDQLFAKSIAALSVNQTLYFTDEQMLYDLEKRLIPKWAWRQITVATMPVKGKLIGYFKQQVILGGGAALILTLCNLPFVIALIIAFSLVHIWSIGNMTRSLHSYTFRQSALSTRAILQDLRKTLGILGNIILAVGIASSLIFQTLPGFISSVLIGMFTIYCSMTLKQSPQMLTPSAATVTLSQLEIWIERWQAINGPITKLLSSVQVKVSGAVNPDITAYSFDRLVVCEEAVIAQFLIANHFHFERNCAILSLDGYPQNIFEVTMQMLRRNPDLKVYALHNCTPAGLQLIEQLRTQARWFQDSDLPIVDVGLSPRQVLKARHLYIQVSAHSSHAAQQLSPDLRQSLTEAELLWLDAGAYLKLAALAPQRLMQWLNQTMMPTRNLEEYVHVWHDNRQTFYVDDNFG